MANYLHTKVKFPLSERTKEALIKKFGDVDELEDGMLIISTHAILPDFLMELSENLRERIVAEHTSSLNRYEIRYLVLYENGEQQTIGVKNKGQREYEYVNESREEIEKRKRMRKEAKEYVKNLEAEAENSKICRPIEISRGGEPNPLQLFALSLQSDQVSQSITKDK